MRLFRATTNEFAKSPQAQAGHGPEQRSDWESKLPARAIAGVPTRTNASRLEPEGRWSSNLAQNPAFPGSWRRTEYSSCPVPSSTCARAQPTCEQNHTRERGRGRNQQRPAKTSPRHDLATSATSAISATNLAELSGVPPVRVLLAGAAGGVRRPC